MRFRRENRVRKSKGETEIREDPLAAYRVLNATILCFCTKVVASNFALNKQSKTNSLCSALLTPESDSARFPRNNAMRHLRSIARRLHLFVFSYFLFF